MASIGNIELHSDKSLNEIYQQVAMRFAFCSVKREKGKLSVKQLHPFVLCRDFLSDALWATVSRKYVSIYRFEFDGAEKQIDLHEMHMLVRFTKAQAFHNALRILNYYEQRIPSWKKTRMVILPKKHKDQSVALFIGSKRWLSSFPILSLFTLLVRSGASESALEEPNFEVPFMLRNMALRKEGNDGAYLWAAFAHTKQADPIETMMRRARFVSMGGVGKFVDKRALCIHEQAGFRSFFRPVRGRNFPYEKASVRLIGDLRKREGLPAFELPPY